jgi:DNA-binding NarL/FixJ family response regulator
VILADDHAMVRQGVRALILRLTDWDVVGEARTAEEAKQMAQGTAAELLVLDVAMPIMGGVAVLESLRASKIALPVLVLSMVPASQYVPYLKTAGAHGFVGKEEDESVLLLAMRRVMAGGTYFPRAASRLLTERPNPPGQVAKLSTREAAVAKAIQEGRPLVSLALELGIGARSIATYRRRLLNKLGVANNAELIGLLKLPE